MVTRQKVLLRFVERAAGPISRLRLTKLCFLLSREGNFATQSAVAYQFTPYLWGPFSFTLDSELGSLLDGGEVVPSDRHHVRRARGRPAVRLDSGMHALVDALWAEHSGLSTSALLRRVYQRHPWFTLNARNEERRAVARPATACAVYTCGYEAMQVDGFLNLLLERGIRQLIDVRANALSRRYGFYGATLAGICGKLDIVYRHFPEAGIPAAWRADLTLGDTQAYRKLFERYEREVLPEQTVVLARIAALLRARPSVLVCQEADPNFCHRWRLAVALSKMTGLPVLDLRSPAGSHSCPSPFSHPSLPGF